MKLPNPFGCISNSDTSRIIAFDFVGRLFGIAGIDSRGLLKPKILVRFDRPGGGCGTIPIFMPKRQIVPFHVPHNVCRHWPPVPFPAANRLPQSGFSSMPKQRRPVSSAAIKVEPEPKKESRTAAPPRSPAATIGQSDDEIYTGSILYMRRYGSTCRQLLFENHTRPLSDNGNVDCERAAYRGGKHKSSSFSRPEAISTGLSH